MLHQPLPERIWFYHIDHAANTATFKALDTDFSVKKGVEVVVDDPKPVLVELRLNLCGRLSVGRARRRQILIHNLHRTVALLLAEYVHSPTFP